MNLARLKVEMQDLLALVLLPAGFAMLPGPWIYKLARALVCRLGLYTDAEDISLREMSNQVESETPVRQLRNERRLTLLLDHADLYLSSWRSRRWRNRQLKVTGRWPEPDEAAILLTFHWGAGFWALHHARDHGLNAHMLVNEAREEHFAGHAVRYAYIRRRIRRISAILGYDTIDAQTNVRPVLQALKAGHQIIAVIDVPAPAGAGAEPVQLMGRTAYIPRALLRLSVEQQLPVYVYVCGIDYADGTRTLDIKRLDPTATVPLLANQVFELLNKAIEEKPAAWHLWSECHRFFNAPHFAQASD